MILSALMFIWLGHPSYAQKEANIWYFGHHAGLDFTSSYPVALQNSAMQTHGGSTVISDPQSGELLFYSNGENIWNKNHQVMYNGNDLFGTSTADQCALIVPFPGFSNRFYLFTIKAVYTNGIASNMYYSIIDMSLDNGLGGVTTKNEMLVSNVTENQIAVKHNNGINYWLVTHEANSDAFLSFEISKDGISSAIVNSIGSIYYTDRFSNDSEIKFSPDGTMIAGGQGSSDVSSIALYDFDASNGKMSNYRPVIDLSSHYGTCFSPDNTKLYISGVDIDYLETTGDIGDYIYQFDLSIPTLNAIRDSRLPLFSIKNSVTNIGKYSATLAAGMQIGPDGRIYVAGNITTYDETGSSDNMERNALVVIEQPNLRGFDCYVTLKFFDFGQGRVFPGLPNFVQNTFNMRVPNEQETPCDSNQAYSVFPNPARDHIKIRIQQECFQPYNFELYNNLGQLLKHGSVFTRESHLIELNHLSDGVYMLYFRQADRIVVKKFLKYTE